MAEWTVVDGNEAVADVAYRLSEVIAIYPITPSSAMGEFSDEWSARRRTNLFGDVPSVVEMQSEGGAAGAIHGALQAGALATTFTSSQGLLLMIPNMYKIAGELTPCVLHVAARTIATHALSIFGDHSDVMGCRQTGFAMLASGSVQEAQDLAAVAHAATLESRVPFLHFFDGFRTSHEVSKIESVPDAVLRELVSADAIAGHKQRALSPDHPVVRGTAHNPDTYFQAREASSPWYARCPDIVAAKMERFAALTGRRYDLFDYAGHPEAERVVIVMGSGADTVRSAVSHLVGKGEKVGVLEVRLYRPFAIDRFLAKLPATVKRIAVLDRTKEPGAPGEPLYLDVVSAIRRRSGAQPRVIGGRFGLSSKEFTPSMAIGVFGEAAKADARDGFTVGIDDDVSNTSVAYDRAFELRTDGVVEAVFYGLGSDGTVSANKSSIHILGHDEGRFAQGYFVYDSKKSGTMTTSHLRFGPAAIRAPYLVTKASFVAVHQFSLLQKHDLLERAANGATLLLNAPFPHAEIWDQLPREAQQQIVEKKLNVFAIDAHRVAREVGMRGRIGVILQACFFAASGVIPREEAISRIREAIRDTYGRKGEDVVRKNVQAVERALTELRPLAIPGLLTAKPRLALVPADAPLFVRQVTARLMAFQGDELPVSAFPVDGTWPSGTTRWEKRAVAEEVPAWEPSLCIQCNKCALVCPHAAIRAKVYPEKQLATAPTGFASLAWKGPELAGSRYTIQVSADDCTGCQLCVEVCPGKDKKDPGRKSLAMKPHGEERERQKDHLPFFLSLPEVARDQVRQDVKGSQLLQPLFEYSGACSGCGETPYVKLLTQLFGDRLLVANATGCSSIYGGNLPTTPWSMDAGGRGPAWANSLFEDNAEFGLGMRVAVDVQTRAARELLQAVAGQVGDVLVKEILDADQASEGGIMAQRRRVAQLREKLAKMSVPSARRLEQLSEYLVKRSVWIVGGDGWAYDIGYGGLDHVLATGADVKVLVLDTEVYSNTGGQASKATPLGAAARFAVNGKARPKKDLGLLAMSGYTVYVAQVALGAKDVQTVRAILEAEAYPGPALVIAYSPCIAHGFEMHEALHHQKLAVDAGAWPLYRFDPRRLEKGEPALKMDSEPPEIPLSDFLKSENRFKTVEARDPERAKMLVAAAEEHANRRDELYRYLASLRFGPKKDVGPAKA